MRYTTLITFDEKNSAKLKKKRTDLGIEEHKFPTSDRLYIPVDAMTEDPLPDSFGTKIKVLVTGFAKNNSCEAFTADIFRPENPELADRFGALPRTIIPLATSEDLTSDGARIPEWNDLIFGMIQPFTVMGEYTGVAIDKDDEK